MSDGCGRRGIRGLRFNESDMDGSHEFAGGEVEKLVARTIIVVPDEHAWEGHGGEFVPVAVLHAEVGRATAYLYMSEVSGDTMENGVRNTA
jgi:hypothetical protein